MTPAATHADRGWGVKPAASGNNTRTHHTRCHTCRQGLASNAGMLLKQRQGPGNSIVPGTTHADSSEVRFGAQRGGQANIGNFGVVAICQQHVGGLDVKVDPAAAVQKMQSARNVQGNALSPTPPTAWLSACFSHGGYLTALQLQAMCIFH